MHIEISPWIQAGFGSLCVMMLGILFWIIRRLLRMIHNDLYHIARDVRRIDATIKTLPCREIGGCEPVCNADYDPEKPHPHP